MCGILIEDLDANLNMSKLQTSLKEAVCNMAQ